MDWLRIRTRCTRPKKEPKRNERLLGYSFITCKNSRKSMESNSECMARMISALNFESNFREVEKVGTLRKFCYVSSDLCQFQWGSGIRNLDLMHRTQDRVFDSQKMRKIFLPSLVETIISVKVIQETKRPWLAKDGKKFLLHRRLIILNHCWWPSFLRAVNFGKKTQKFPPVPAPVSPHANSRTHSAQINIICLLTCNTCALYQYETYFIHRKAL